MTSWYIEPRDPLVVRDGRPNDGRSESATLPFPLPSTCAGLCRTQLGSDPGRGFVLGHRLGELEQTSLRGPLLADTAANTLLFPAPRDVRLEELDDGSLRARSLAPLTLPDGVEHDDDDGLSLVGAAGEDAERAGKPPREPHTFWPWKAIERALRGPLRLDGTDVAELLDDGVKRLPTEARTHVTLDRETQTAQDGMLFGTTGLRFAVGCAESLSTMRSLALFLDFDAAAVAGREVREGLAPLAGKRRLARWTRSATALPAIPEWLTKHVRDARTDTPLRLRVLLATPAIFRLGYGPSPDSPVLPPIAKLVAALVPRPETVSGWNFAVGAPKPTRRMAAAGSVYWLDLEGDAAARLAWLKGVWMQNISDDAQHRRDGFGLALVGVGT